MYARGAARSATWRTASRCHPIPKNRKTWRAPSACSSCAMSSSPAWTATTWLEILVPDFRGRLDIALDALASSLPDVLNHNLETVPRLYPLARPGADYAHSRR